MIRLFDAHTHLNDAAFFGREQYYLDRAQKMNVVKMAVAGQDERFNQRAVDLANQFDHVYAMVGYCPDVAKDFKTPQQNRLIEQLQLKKTVALGEIGLDYYWDASPRPVQRQVFADQLAIAHRLKIPVNIHLRDAFPDAYDILKESHVGEDGGVLHSFNGDHHWLHRFLDLGLMVSYSGVVSFTKAVDVHESAKETPLDRILIETDAPYLTPKPYRGRQNEPGYTAYVAQAIAQLKGLPIDQIAQATYENAERIYGIQEETF